MTHQQRWIANPSLLVGAGLIIGSGLFTLTHLTDRVVLSVLVPGVVVGLLLIGLYWMTRESEPTG